MTRLPGAACSGCQCHHIRWRAPARSSAPSMLANSHAPLTTHTLPLGLQSCSGWARPPSLSTAGRLPSGMPTRSACCCRCWCRPSGRRAAMCAPQLSGTCGGRRRRSRPAPPGTLIWFVFPSVSSFPYRSFTSRLHCALPFVCPARDECVLCCLSFVWFLAAVPSAPMNFYVLQKALRAAAAAPRVEQCPS